MTRLRKYVLVSACLLGLNTKYDGGNNKDENIIKLLSRGKVTIIPVCPEQLGGLPTPRDPIDLTSDGHLILTGKGKAISVSGDDLTDYLVRGAIETLKLAKLYNVRLAIFKARSPSCGVRGVYRAKDHKLVDWDGVTTALLKKNKIKVVSNEAFQQIRNR